MRKFTMNLKQLLLLAVLMAAVVVVPACKDDDDNNDKNEEQQQNLDIDAQVADVQLEVVSDKLLKAEEMADEIFGPSGANGDEALEKFRAAFVKRQQELAERLAAENGANGLATGWRSINYKYQSVDEQGKTVWLSARVYWGTYWAFGTHDMDPDYIVLCPHLTIGSNSECPTEKHTYEAAAICGDNLVIMPDYLGFGATKDRPQPYTNHELCAQNSIDALKAGYKVFLDKTDAKLEDDYKMYVIGASQGGGNALAIHKWLDTHPDFAKSWRFEYSYCCAGPYSPSLTFQKYFEQKKHPYPCVFPFVLNAMFAAYPDVLGKWKMSDFYNDDYVKNHYEEMEKIVASKESDTKAVSAKFFSWYPHTGEDGIKGGEEIYISDILHPDLFDTNSEKYKALFACLDKNNLTTGWTPTHKIYLYHGKDDDIVPFANAEAVKSAFGNQVELSESGWGTGGHIGTCMKWLGQILINNW